MKDRVSKSFLLLFIFSLSCFPTSAFAQKPEHLQFSFRIHCEEEEDSCDSKIPEDEEEEVFLFPYVSQSSAKIGLMIENPKREMITSVRAKLKFYSEEVLVTDIETEDSDFEFEAPNENKIDAEEGIVSIGRSFIGAKSRNDKEFLVATLTIRPIKSGAKIDFLNYQFTELGDTGIFFNRPGSVTVENRLREEPKPLQIGKTGGTHSSPIPPESSSIPRPTDLRLQTDDGGNVRLIWATSDEENIRGYYLYYSQKSGYYLRRRDVGNTSSALFPDLLRGKKYYFALTAYDERAHESDYSDEVFVTVGLLGSESHAFTGDPNAYIGGPETKESPEGSLQETKEIKEIPEKNELSSPPSEVNRTTDSGPAHIIFFFLISAGLVFLGMFFRRSL
jgi:hypothetical protein